MKKILRFFDRLEDIVRGALSRLPILYAFIAGLGMVLFWRGAWHTFDALSQFFLDPSGRYFPISYSQLMDGPTSLLISFLLLLATGSFVSTFIGNEIIISGLRHEKKMAEKTEEEVETEGDAITHIKKELQKINDRLEQIEGKLDNRKGG